MTPTELTPNIPPLALGFQVIGQFLGTPLAWILALGYLFRRPPTQARFLLAGFFFCVGVWHLAGALAGTSWIYLYPWQYRTEIPFTWLTGPLGYFYFRLTLEDGFVWRRAHIFCFLPGLLAFLFYIPLFQISDKVDFIHRTIHRQSFDMYQTAIMLGAAQNLLYLLLGGLRYFAPGRYRLRKRHKTLLLLLVLFAFAATLIDLFAWNRIALFDLQGNIRLFTLSTSLALFAILLASIIRPGFMSELVERLKEGRYRRTRLAGMDLDAVRIHLLRLMEAEDLYVRNDLTLEVLAKMLDLNGPQLSQFINQEFGKNFNTFVNEYRVREACRLLEENPEMVILHVCYGAGFHTPSSFHTAFKSVTGKTPAEYRKNIRDHDSG